MLADGPQVQERQRKRNGKLLAALILAAAAGIAGAWLLEENLQLRKPDLDWLEDSALAVSDHLVVTADRTQIQVCSIKGKELYQIELSLEDPAAVVRGDQILVYTPGGTTLARLDGKSYDTWEIASGIDGAAVSSEGKIAVITAASGCLSVIQLWSPQGEILEVKSRENAAAGLVTFLSDGTLAACYVTDQGRWILETDRDTELSATVVYEMRPCGDDLALWTSDGLEIYSKSGEALAQLSLRPGQIQRWACDTIVAAVVWQEGGYRLVTLSPDGTACRSSVLTEVPQDVAVWKSFVSILDSREVLIYDNRCSLRTKDQAGSRACRLWRVSGGFRMTEM
jgi:hypothetical protein